MLFRLQLPATRRSIDHDHRKQFTESFVHQYLILYGLDKANQGFGLERRALP